MDKERLYLFFHWYLCVRWRKLIIEKEENAEVRLNEVTEKWKGQYPGAMGRWYDNWDAIATIFKFSKDTRTAFYTTYTDKKNYTDLFRHPAVTGIS